MVLPYKGLLYEATTMFHGQGPIYNGRKEPCSDFELNTVECLEAYGAIKGAEKCAKFIEDLNECKHTRLRVMRKMIMQEERMKKVAKGEIPFEKRWGKPYAYDSHVQGTFFP